jgi:hypothetical protein
LKALLENYSKPSIIFFKDFSASLLAKEKSYKCFIKLSLPKDCLKNILQKLSYKDLSLILKRVIQNPNSICIMQIKTLGLFI